ncbi:MAG: pitrilysin family protein [Candidatus Aminicenantes bacterium]|nr:pitrilysin family protein [Candidatus Aminicenantes bacterium]
MVLDGFQRRVWNNGLVLLTCQNDRLPVVSVNAFVLAGTDQNPLRQPGLAALASRMLEEGTAKYRADDISRLVEDAGGNLSTCCQHELTGISLHLRDRDLPEGLDLAAQMVSRPTFPRQRFGLEREKALTRLEALEDDPQVVVSNLLNREIYRGGPLQFPGLGTPASLRRLQIEDIREFHRLRYAPENTVVVVVGNAGHAQVADLVDRRLGSWRNGRFRKSRPPVPRRQRAPRVRQRVLEGREQVHVCLGHLGVTRDHPDFYALQVMDAVLGSGPGFTSRIPRELRDRRGLAYATYSDLTGSAGRYPGRFLAYICTSPSNRDAAVSGLMEEIESLIEDGPTEEELELARNYLTGSFVFGFQSNAHVARFLLTAERFGLDPDFIRRYPDWIRAVDAEEVRRVARRHLDTVNFTTIIAGPEYASTR